MHPKLASTKARTAAIARFVVIMREAEGRTAVGPASRRRAFFQSALVSRSIPFNHVAVPGWVG